MKVVFESLTEPLAEAAYAGCILCTAGAPGATWAARCVLFAAGVVLYAHARSRLASL